MLVPRYSNSAVHYSAITSVSAARNDEHVNVLESATGVSCRHDCLNRREGHCGALPAHQRSSSKAMLKVTLHCYSYLSKFCFMHFIIGL